MTLKRLRATGRRLLDMEFLKGTRQLGTDEYQSLLEDVVHAPDLDEFDRCVTDAIRESAEQSPEVDRKFAPKFHRALPLDRRTASDEGIWRYLAVVRHPEFIRHRWTFTDRKTTAARFWSMGTRPDSNGFARLWWIAEMTELDRDYELTRRVFESTTLTNAIFTRNFSRFRPAVAAFVDTLGDASVATIESTARQLHTLLTTIPLESRSEAELRQLIGRVADS